MRRANGEGTIYKIKSGKREGTWVAQITLGSNPETGRPRRKSFYGRTRGEAIEKRDAYLTKIGQGLDIDKAKVVTFGEWLVEWLDLYKKDKVRVSTFEGYLLYIKNLVIPKIGLVPLASLSTNDIQGLYNHLQRTGRKPATIQKTHRIISQSLDKAVETRLISWNPAKATERPAVQKSGGQAMTAEEMEKFIKQVYQEPEKWKAAFLTLLGTGIRIGELLALEWGDVDLEKGLLSINKTLSKTAAGLVVNKPKTDTSEGIVPIPKNAINALKKHKTAQKAHKLLRGTKYQDEKITIVFASDVGTHIQPRNFARKFYSILEKAGLGHYNVHCLRHTFATRLLEEGESLEVVRRLLRHADIATTANIYSHVTVKTKEKAVQKLDRLLGEK